MAPDTVIYPTQLPTQMASPLFGKLAEVQNALAPLANQVPGQQFRWTSSPTGQVKPLHDLRRAGPASPGHGRRGRTRSRSATRSDCVLTASGMQLQLTANVYALPLLMQIGYYAARPVTLAVTFGGHQYQVTLPASELAYAYLPVQGPGNSVVITPVTPDPKICIGTVTIGNVQASATGTPVPAFPLPG